MSLRPNGRRYGYIKDTHDSRDRVFSAILPWGSLPPAVDLRTKFPVPAYDQSTLGSCSGNAIAGIHHFDQYQLDPAKAFTPSRLFIYMNERILEGTVTEDAGAMIRDGIKTLVQQGVCPETMWPYDISQFTVRPTQACYDEAMKHQAIEYSRVMQLPHSLKSCLAGGHPFVFGFQVYENFEDEDVAKTGIMHMPAGNNVGGHAVAAYAYDDARQVYIIRNSWGTVWGQAGYFEMPYAYMHDPRLVSDIWMVKTVEV